MFGVANMIWLQLTAVSLDLLTIAVCVMLARRA
jgi:hypothetical protein